MKEFRFIDDHTGEKADFNVIGIWRKGGKIGLAIDGIHCINGLYVDEDENLHLSTWSIGPTALDGDIARGELESTSGTWKLEKMSLNKIYETVKEAGQTSPVL